VPPEQLPPQHSADVEQACPCALHVAEAQTPDVQLFDMQSLLVVHDCPLAFTGVFPQKPSEQTLPAHSA
jgi:hypothetical protein